MASALLSCIKSVSQRLINTQAFRQGISNGIWKLQQRIARKYT